MNVKKNGISYSEEELMRIEVRKDAEKKRKLAKAKKDVVIKDKLKKK